MFTRDVIPVSYSLADAASAVGLSERTLSDAIRDGSLVAHYQGRKALILRDDLRDWIESLPTTRPSERVA